MLWYRARNIEGERFGRLVAIAVDGRDPQRRLKWRCACDCGSHKTLPSRHLVQGLVRSCGCLGAEVRPLNGRRGAHKISGAKSHLFKPQLSDEERLGERNVVAIREWRKGVFERADYACDLCGERAGRLAAHHLNSWAQYPAERFVPSNGVCLCAAHHKEFHDGNGGPRKPSTADQYAAFKARWYVAREIAKRKAAQP